MQPGCNASARSGRCRQQSAQPLTASGRLRGASDDADRRWKRRLREGCVLDSIVIVAQHRGEVIRERVACSASAPTGGLVEQIERSRRCEEPCRQAEYRVGSLPERGDVKCWRVIDIRLPPDQRARAARQIRADLPELGIILLSPHVACSPSSPICASARRPDTRGRPRSRRSERHHPIGGGNHSDVLRWGRPLGS